MPKIQSWLSSGGRQPSSEQPSSSSGLRRVQRVQSADSGRGRLPAASAMSRRSDLGQLALRRRLPLGARPGCPEPRPASANQRFGPRWAHTQAFDLDIQANGMNADEMREPIGLRRLQRPRRWMWCG